MYIPSYLPRIAFEAEGLGGGETPATTFSADYVRELRAENKGLRLKLRGFEDENPKLKLAADDAENRVKEATKNATRDATATFNQRLINSELRAAATAAGMLDLDGLKLLDTSKITVGDDGSVKLPEGFFEAAKEAKGYLFKSPTGAETGTTTQTQQTPRPAATTNKNVSTMNPDEMAAFERSLGINF